MSADVGEVSVIRPRHTDVRDTKDSNLFRSAADIGVHDQLTEDHVRSPVHVDDVKGSQRTPDIASGYNLQGYDTGKAYWLVSMSRTCKPQRVSLTQYRADGTKERLSSILRHSDPEHGCKPSNDTGRDVE